MKSNTTEVLSTLKPTIGSLMQSNYRLESFSSKSSSSEKIDCRILKKKTSFVQKKTLIDNYGKRI